MASNRLIWYVFISFISFWIGYFINILPQLYSPLIIPYFGIMFIVKEINQMFAHEHIREAVAKSLNNKINVDFFTFNLIICRASFMFGCATPWIQILF